MTNVVTPGLTVTYIRSTGQHAPASNIGCSTCWEDVLDLKYMRNGHEIEHHAPFDRVLFPIRSPSPSPGFRDMLSFGTARCAVAPPCLSTRTQSDRHFPDLAGACARRGGGYMLGCMTGNPGRIPLWHNVCFRNDRNQTYCSPHMAGHSPSCRCGMWLGRMASYLMLFITTSLPPMWREVYCRQLPQMVAAAP